MQTNTSAEVDLAAFPDRLTTLGQQLSLFTDRIPSIPEDQNQPSFN